MNRKYNMGICKCGRIHMLDNEVLDRALENNKNLLLICAGCGNAILIGAHIEPDLNEPDYDCYMIYFDDFSRYNDRSIGANDFESTENHKGIEEIIYSHGYKVPMITGKYATDYCNGRFYDIWYPDFYKIQRSDITVKEIMEFIDKYKHDRITVNMNRFIRETPDEILEEISHYYIEGFNFKGTKWETVWNSN